MGETEDKKYIDLLEIVEADFPKRVNLIKYYRASLDVILKIKTQMADTDYRAIVQEFSTKFAEDANRFKVSDKSEGDVNYNLQLQINSKFFKCLLEKYPYIEKINIKIKQLQPPPTPKLSMVGLSWILPKQKQEAIINFTHEFTRYPFEVETVYDATLDLRLSPNGELIYNINHPGGKYEEIPKVPESKIDKYFDRVEPGDIASIVNPLLKVKGELGGKPRSSRKKSNKNPRKMIKSKRGNKKSRKGSR